MESVGDPAERGVWIFGKAKSRSVGVKPEAPGRKLGYVRRSVRVEASAVGRSRAALDLNSTVF